MWPNRTRSPSNIPHFPSEILGIKLAPLRKTTTPLKRAIPILLAVVAGANPQEPPDVRVSVRVVTLPTLVFSKENHLIPNLQNGDFRVTDNGKPQDINVEPDYAPLSIALAVQTNHDVREYSRFIAKVGSVVDAMLVGESGESALITYNSEVQVAKPFDGADVQGVMRQISPSGTSARMIDAGLHAIRLLSHRPRTRTRILLFIGQSFDKGSKADVASLQRLAEQENVVIYALVLPQIGQAFVSDTFSLEGLSSRTQRGGFKVGVDLGNLVSVLNHSASGIAMSDPLSILTSATGGAQLHVRTQGQLESGLSIIGVETRSAYLLSFYPTSRQPGYHTVRVDVNVRGAKIFSRPGYWW